MVRLFGKSENEKVKLESSVWDWGHPWVVDKMGGSIA